jgi:hypothetical protein
MEKQMSEGLKKPGDQRVDVFEHSFREWLKHNHAVKDGPLAGQVAAFVNFQRDLYSKNQPIAMDYLGEQLGLRFQDGTILPFVATTGPGQVGSNTGSMDLTKSAPAVDGKGRTAPSRSWGVTGNE